MAFQGEAFVERYGTAAARHTPPVRRMLAAGVPVGAGTDATRVASYNPWTALYWLVTGNTLGGLSLYGADNRLDRETALRLWTEGSAWFSTESGKKGRIAVGQLADFALLSADYMSVPEPDILHLQSVLTVVGGRIVHASGDFHSLAPPRLPVSPDWSPNKAYALEQRDRVQRARRETGAAAQAHGAHCHAHAHGGGGHAAPVRDADRNPFWGALGCSCFAF
jgi:imidazolonepropionase-like amidohydrolase